MVTLKEIDNILKYSLFSSDYREIICFCLRKRCLQVTDNLTQCNLAKKLYKTVVMHLNRAITKGSLMHLCDPRFQASRHLIIDP